jgi:hypothetical protein
MPVRDHASSRQMAQNAADGEPEGSVSNIQKPDVIVRQRDHDLLRLSWPQARARNGEAAEIERRGDLDDTAEPLFAGAEQGRLGGYAQHLGMAAVRETVIGANSRDAADLSPPPTTSPIDFDERRLLSYENQPAPRAALTVGTAGRSRAPAEKPRGISHA